VVNVTSISLLDANSRLAYTLRWEPTIIVQLGRFHDAKVSKWWSSAVMIIPYYSSRKSAPFCPTAAHTFLCGGASQAPHSRVSLWVLSLIYFDKSSGLQLKASFFTNVLRCRFFKPLNFIFITWADSRPSGDPRVNSPSWQPLRIYY
jgi:hypothetical protein